MKFAFVIVLTIIVIVSIGSSGIVQLSGYSSSASILNSTALNIPETAANSTSTTTSNTTSSTTSTTNTTTTSTSTQSSPSCQGPICNVSFTESGLPSGTTWEVVLGNQAQAGSISTLNFQYVDQGNYSWIVKSPIAGTSFTQYITSSNSSGSIDVPYQTSVSIKFLTQYQVQINDSSNLDGQTSPSGIYWYNASSVIPINATAYSGFSFISWNSTGFISVANSSAPSTTAMIKGAGSITADFGNATSTTNVTTTTTNSTTTNTTTTTSKTNSTTTSSLTNSTTTTTNTSSTTTSTTSAISSTNSSSVSTIPSTTNATSYTSSTHTSNSTTDTMSNSTTSTSLTSNSDKTTSNGKSTNIAALFYTVPFVTTQNPSLLGTLIFSAEVVAVVAAPLAIRRLTNKEKENSTNESRGWHW